MFYICYNYFKEYDDIYNEYDRINSSKPRGDTDEKNIFFKGKIGTVRIYHRALSPFEVGKRHDATRDLYLADSPPPPKRECTGPGCAEVSAGRS